MGTAQNPSVFLLPSAVITRMQINADLDGLQEVVISALQGAQLHAQTILDSPMDIKSQDCTFFVDSEAFSGITPGGQFRLEIPAMFVRKDTPVKVYSDTTWMMNSPVLMPSTSYRMDYEKGVLYIDATGEQDRFGNISSYAESYVRVTCKTGFNPCGDLSDPEGSPPEDIPDWLGEAIMAYVGLVLDVSQTTNRQGDAMNLYKRAGDHATAILTPHLRRRGLTFRPIG